jgi:hypothetical protein
MSAIWHQHAHAEFVLKNADTALATMTGNPYVLCIPSGMGGTGRAGVREFYARQFLPNIPPDFESSSPWWPSSGSKLAKSPTSTSTGIRPRCSPSWALRITPSRRQASLARHDFWNFRNLSVSVDHKKLSRI